MKYFFALGIIISLTFQSAIAADKIPIPDKPAEYDTAKLITDPENGDQLVADQLVIVFDEDIRSLEQKRILTGIRGRIIGGNPAMNMYQVSFPNPDRSIESLMRICQELSKNKKIVHVAPRKIKVESLEKIDLSKRKKVKRVGSVEMDASGRESKTEDKVSLDPILARHKEGLYDCIRNRVKGHGEILYRIHITPIGQVKKVNALKSDIRDKKIMDCLEYRIMQWSDFPEENVKFDRRIEFTFKF